MLPMNAPDRFEDLAASWDVDPVHVARTRDVARGIRERVPLRGRRALEVGAGTGLLSFALSSELESVVASDPSPGMIAVLEDKIRQSGAGNVRALASGDDLRGIEGPFDLAMLQMALHHIADIASFLDRVSAILAPGGFLAIADLDTEDGSFHGPEVEDVHPGFERVDLVHWIAEAGIEPVSIETVHTMRRKTPQGERDYPIFLAVARKA